MEGARVSFLENAAHLTNSRSPSTSAHLVSERQTLTRSSQTAAFSQSLDACQRCGTIATSIWELKPAGITSSKQSSSRKPLAEPSTRIVVRRCSACGNVAKLSTDRKMKPPRLLKAQPPSPTLAAPAPWSSPTLSGQARNEPKLSSKKRAKARKDREGLQTLLNQKKPNSTTPQMNLLDFMKR